ncbi:uncharacterized protein LOC133368960 isoform X1 [Rhineura floridana]|uniref:uncharacterized protein LOC133368960 isoform X1 n=1 Tax=Rhineura floridana TaxID=261503 RepID=UPI002AC86873|nr:uncharacterized protein LOC133368960 isoform X1 [Rhineura floridana]
MAGLGARSVLVTGANRGIGLELVRQLLGSSDPPQWLFACCRDPDGERGQQLRKLASSHPNLTIVKLDTCDPSSIKAAVARATEQLNGARLNLLINNAGIVRQHTLESETSESMSEVYKTNVIGPMMVTQAFLPLLRKASEVSSQKGMSCSKAAIVNISSLCGSITDILAWELGHNINYRCSKAALNMLTQCQSRGFAEDEILCISLHPGWLQTDMGNLIINPRRKSGSFLHIPPYFYKEQGFSRDIKRMLET